MKKYLLILILLLLPLSLWSAPITNNWLVWNGVNWGNQSTSSLNILTIGTTSDALAEGSTNLFYALSKVQTALIGGYNSIFGIATTTTLVIPSITNSILAVDGTGKVIATTTSAGGVTTVSGTYPVISSGGATPAISLALSTTSSNTWGGTQTFGVIKTGTTSAFCAFDNNGIITSTTSPAGADTPVASPTVSGKAKLSVVAVDTGDPIVVGDNDQRITGLQWKEVATLNFTNSSTTATTTITTPGAYVYKIMGSFQNASTTLGSGVKYPIRLRVNGIASTSASYTTYLNTQVGDPTGVDQATGWAPVIIAGGTTTQMYYFDITVTNATSSSPIMTADNIMTIDGNTYTPLGGILTNGVKLGASGITSITLIPGFELTGRIKIYSSIF